MQTVGQPVTNNPLPKLNVEWTFTNNYADEAAVKKFEEQIIAIEKLEIITKQEIDQLQQTLNSLFITKTDNYWYGQARLNTLASRLPKQSKDERILATYPITLKDFDEKAIELDMNHEYFAYGKTAREWMKYWLSKNNRTIFENETSVQENMTLAVSVFKEFWSKFQAISNQEDWQQVMKDELGFEIEDECISNAFYNAYLKEKPLNSLTNYQSALSKAVIRWEQLTVIPVAKHPFMKKILRQHGIHIGVK